MSNLCKILIVDDEYLLRQGLRYLCNWEKEGFTIVGEAASGEEAIELTKTLTPDIVITDIVMPDMDGIELTKQIKLHNPLIEIIVLSSYSDFDYVKKAFKYGARDYILKPKLQPNELLPILKNLKCVCRNSSNSSSTLSLKESISITLQALLNGFNCDEVQLNQINEFFNNTEFFLLLTDATSYSRTTSQRDLKTMIFPPLLMDEYLHNFTYSDCIVIQNTYAVLINTTFSQASVLNSQIDQLTTLQHNQFNLLHFAISTSFTSLELLKTTFEDTKTLLSYQFFLENQVLIQPELVISEIKQLPFDFDLFYNLIESLDVEKVNIHLTNYINLATETLSFNVFSLKKLVENIIYNSINILKKLRFNMSNLNILKLRYLKNIEDTTSASLLIQVVTSIFNEIFDEVNLQSDRKNTIIVQKIMLYIEENYQEQIYLSTVAAKLHLNYHYISSHFNNYAKESFSDHLNRVRIKKAKEFLVNPTITISQVSELVGYSDQSYFGKVFKKSTGSSPSTYRKKHLII